MSRKVALIAGTITGIMLGLILVAAAGAQPTLAQVNAKVDSLRSEVAAVAKISGSSFAPFASSELKAALIPSNALPSGRWPLFLSDYQLRLGIAEIASQAAATDVATNRQGALLVALSAKLDSLASNPAPVTPAPVPISTVITSPADLPGISSGGAGYLTLRSNLTNAPTQNGITDSYWGQISMNGWDGGLRLCQNYRYAGTGILPYACWGGDSRATWSYSQAPARADSAGTGAIETYGQSLVIDGGFAQQGYDWSTGAPLARGVLIAGQRGSQPLMFAITPTRSIGTFATNRVFLRGSADPSGNPVEVTIDGTLRRLKSCNIGGITVVCF